MQLLRGLAAGRRAISPDLLPFRVQLRPLGTGTSPLPSFPFPPPFGGPSSPRAAGDLAGSDSRDSSAASPAVQVQKTLCQSGPEFYLGWKRQLWNLVYVILFYVILFYFILFYLTSKAIYCAFITKSISRYTFATFYRQNESDLKDLEKQLPELTVNLDN